MSSIASDSPPSRQEGWAHHRIALTEGVARARRAEPVMAVHQPLPRHLRAAVTWLLGVACDF